MLVLWGGPQPSDANADGFSDENTLLIAGGSQTYGAITIPAGANASVTGMPVSGPGDRGLRSFHGDFMTFARRISEGSGGTDVSTGKCDRGSGSATGRTAFGLYEYTVTATFSTVTLVPGEYWFNLEPQCLNTLDGKLLGIPAICFQYHRGNKRRKRELAAEWRNLFELVVFRGDLCQLGAIRPSASTQSSVSGCRSV